MIQIKDLIKQLHKDAADLSYFNAAEGDCYKSEYIARSDARIKFLNIKQQCIEAGIDVAAAMDGRGYLI